MTQRKRKLAVISGFDSQFKWGAAVAKRFFSAGWEIEFFCPTVRQKQISEKQLRTYGIPFPIHFASKHELFETTRLGEFDVLLFSLPAGLTEEGTLGLKRTYDALEKNFPSSEMLLKRPLIVAGFVGVNYENRLGSVVARRLADIILANSDEERTYFETTAETLAIEQTTFVTGGLGLIDTSDSKRHHGQASNARRVLYAAQPTVPATKAEKVYLLLNLLKIAAKNPSWKVVVKPRHRPGEETFHKDKHHLETTFAEFFGGVAAPPNFQFDYRPISTQLTETNLLLTVSSTAALEAYSYGVPFGILTDFGIKEPYGASFFGDSGAHVTFAQLASGITPTPNPEWVARNIAYADEQFVHVLAAVEARLQEQEAAARFIPFSETAYDRARWDTIRFVDEWRRTRRKVPWVQRQSSLGIGPRPSSSTKEPSLLTGQLETFRRKTRKLFRDPRAFVRDSRFLR